MCNLNRVFLHEFKNHQRTEAILINYSVVNKPHLNCYRYSIIELRLSHNNNSFETYMLPGFVCKVNKAIHGLSLFLIRIFLVIFLRLIDKS